jgi:organic hydroperoxide reductase OsmC/OhrA
MPDRQHNYEVSLEWTGAGGSGTRGYASYERSHLISAGGKPSIPGSSDPHFRGDASRWNPEELLVGAISACHQLWYLHLCAVNQVTVAAYRDRASGAMVEHADGSGEFIRVVLRPDVEIAAGSDPETALRLHDEAARLCFLARSVNFPVEHQPSIKVAG